jgi:hypothetical protein
MLKTSYDYVYEACNHVLINENTRKLSEKEKSLRVLFMISHVELMKWKFEVEMRCFSEENRKIVYQSRLFLKKIKLTPTSVLRSIWSCITNNGSQIDS